MRSWLPTPRAARSAADRLPDRPRRLLDVVALATRRYVDDGMAERAPAVAYYGILSIFPFCLVGFAVMRLFSGAGAPADLAAYAHEHGASGSIAQTLRSVASTARAASPEGAGSIGLLGVMTLLYGASRAFTAMGRAMDAIEHRPTSSRSVRRRGEDVLWTIVVLAMVLTMVLLVAISGRVLDEALSLVGIEGAGAAAWSVARWPAAVALALLAVAIVRWAAPTHHGRFRLVSAGILVSVGVLALETAGFDLYVSTMATYNATYGAFAGAIILLLWMWLAAIALFFGAELDAVLDGR